jgi:hypothetical protein
VKKKNKETRLMAFFTCHGFMAQAWLQACFDWVLEEHQLQAWQIDELFDLVDSQASLARVWQL